MVYSLALALLWFVPSGLHFAGMRDQRSESFTMAQHGPHRLNKPAVRMVKRISRTTSVLNEIPFSCPDRVADRPVLIPINSPTGGGVQCFAVVEFLTPRWTNYGVPADLLFRG